MNPERSPRKKGHAFSLVWCMWDRGVSVRDRREGSIDKNFQNGSNSFGRFSGSYLFRERATKKGLN